LQYPDVNHGTVKGKPIREVLADSGEWLDGEFISVVQQRGAAIIKVRLGCDTAAEGG
jgi:malate/lactate dehydrogenase